jgi:hypothetical protein
MCSYMMWYLATDPQIMELFGDLVHAKTSESISQNIPHLSVSWLFQMLMIVVDSWQHTNHGPYQKHSMHPSRSAPSSHPVGSTIPNSVISLLLWFTVLPQKYASLNSNLVLTFLWKHIVYIMCSFVFGFLLSLGFWDSVLSHMVTICGLLLHLLFTTGIYFWMSVNCILIIVTVYGDVIASSFVL